MTLSESAINEILFALFGGFPGNLLHQEVQLIALTDSLLPQSRQKPALAPRDAPRSHLSKTVLETRTIRVSSGPFLLACGTLRWGLKEIARLPRRFRPCGAKP